MKTFGGNRPAIQRELFTLKYTNMDEEEMTATFQVLSRVSGGDVAAIMSAMGTDDEGKGVARLMRMLTKVMDNKDGVVKHNWKPTPLEIPEQDTRPEVQVAPPGTPEGWPAESPWSGDNLVAAQVEREPSYRGPDGDIWPLSNKEQLAVWDNQDIWTSRRRWVYLMEEDDTAIVEIQDLLSIAEWVISLGTDRPTPARA